MHERTVRARTATGIVEGFTRDGVHRWRSIPYARAPVGSLRFRAPQPAQPWPGVRHCHTFANCAPQQRRYTVMGIGRYQTRSEDCLTLNVVTPEEPATQPLPVMVFIHGGGYILGSSATPIYDGAALARRGCVYVSVNYRLGALGCLDLSSLSTPQITLDSNVYLRDLVLALRWVHDNIAEFGGDPGNVTIFGESAGAHITATLLAVPAAKGLFARAISESPAAGMVRSREVAAEFAARFANLIGARTQDAANALMQASPAQLVEAQHHLIRQGMRKRLGAFPIGPVFGDDYLPMDPVEAMRSGRVHAVPLIVGTNAEEGRLFTRFLGMLPTNEPMVEELLSGMKPADRERITAAYPNYPAPSACIQLGGDFAFSSAAWQIAEAHGANAPTYLYRYDYAPRTRRYHRRRAGGDAHRQRRVGLQLLMAPPNRDELLAAVERSPQAAAAHDRAGWVGLFTGDARVEDPVGSQPQVGHEAIGRFYDTFIGPRDITFHRDLDIVSGTVVLRDLELEVAMDSAVTVFIPAFLRYDLRPVTGEWQIAALRAYWELPAMMLQFLRTGSGATRPALQLSRALLGNQGLGGTAGFLTGFRRAGRRHKKLVETFLNAASRADKSAAYHALSRTATMTLGEDELLDIVELFEQLRGASWTKVTGAGSTVAVSLASDHRRGIMFADVPWRGNRINRIRYFPA